jgi:hypothetical protein
VAQLPQADVDQVFAEIGRVTVRWAELEEAVSIAIISLLDEYERYTRIVATELSFRARVDLATSLYIERFGDDDEFQKLKALFRKADTLVAKRNQIVHSTWFSAGAPAKVTRLKHSARGNKGFNTQLENHTPESLRTISDEIAAVANDIVDFVRLQVSLGRGFDKGVYEAGG